MLTMSDSLLRGPKDALLIGDAEILAEKICMSMMASAAYLGSQSTWPLDAVASKPAPAPFLLRDAFTANAASPPVEAAPATIGPMVAEQKVHIIYKNHGVTAGKITQVPHLVSLTREHAVQPTP
jgi:hypothetical protein